MFPCSSAYSAEPAERFNSVMLFYAVPAIPGDRYRLGGILRPTRVESKLTKNTVLDSEIVQVLM